MWRCKVYGIIISKQSRVLFKDNKILVIFHHKQANWIHICNENIMSILLLKQVQKKCNKYVLPLIKTILLQLSQTTWTIASHTYLAYAYGHTDTYVYLYVCINLQCNTDTFRSPHASKRFIHICFMLRRSSFAIESYTYKQFNS